MLVKLSDEVWVNPALVSAVYAIPGGHVRISTCGGERIDMTPRGVTVEQLVAEICEKLLNGGRK